MEIKRKNMIISITLIIVAIIYTILVKTVDVQPVGAAGSDIGFSTINKPISEKIGTNMTLYEITEILGKIAICVAAVYAIIGLIQFIKRKSILKVDKELIFLGASYIDVMLIYIFFEKVIINFRPILMEGVLEASYPSSHTLIAMCIFGSAILVNRQIFKNKFTKVLNIIFALLIIVTIVFRFVAGVHWFTDIIGGILISSCLLMTLYSILDAVKNE